MVFFGELFKSWFFKKKGDVSVFFSLFIGFWIAIDFADSFWTISCDRASHPALGSYCVFVLFFLSRLFLLFLSRFVGLCHVIYCEIDFGLLFFCFLSLTCPLSVILIGCLSAISFYLRPFAIFVHSILISSEIYFYYLTCFSSGFWNGFSMSQSRTPSRMTIAKSKMSAILIDLNDRYRSRFPSRLELRDFRLQRFANVFSFHQDACCSVSALRDTILCGP